MSKCNYCGKILHQPTVRHENIYFHLDCYLKKDGSKIFTKCELDDMGRRIEFMAEICDNALDNKLSPEQHEKKFKEILNKYAELTIG